MRVNPGGKLALQFAPRPERPRPTKDINDVNVYTLYMTRMVQLADDAYESLSRAKRAGESFSQTVRRLTRPRASLLELGELGMTDAEHETRTRLLAELDALDKADETRPQNRA